MPRLRFDRAGIRLDQAAIALATSQIPWASQVYCSLYDYISAGYAENGPCTTFAVMENDLNFPIPDEPSIEPVRIYKLLLSPSRTVDVGHVVVE